MSSFESTLKLMGLESKFSEKIGPCTYWKAESIFGNSIVNILQVRANASEAQLEKATSVIDGARDYAIISTTQRTEQISELLDSEFRFKNISVEQNILFESANKLLGQREQMDMPRGLVDSSIHDLRADVTDKGSLQVSQWLRNEQDSPLAMITGPAGFGKTTLCKKIINELNRSTSMKRVPLYISSHHWRKLIASGRLSISSIFLEAVADTFTKAAIGDEMIERLIVSGALVPIFDGLDELCTPGLFVRTREWLDRMRIAAAFCGLGCWDFMGA